jgi:hypothetical protein
VLTEKDKEKIEQLLDNLEYYQRQKVLSSQQTFEE